MKECRKAEIGNSMRIKMIQRKRIVGKMKILLVDDERTEREGIRFLIEKFQFELEVAEAANGKLAMEYLQKYQDVDIY